MAQLVTVNAQIQCTHQGVVTLKPGQVKAVAGDGGILCDPDLVGAPIIGCLQAPSTNTKPCTTVVSVIPAGSVSLKVTVNGKPAYISTLSGVTDGVPPGSISVTDPGQEITSA
jgi:hypothetical protein